MLKVVSFFGSADARGEVTLVSDIIGHPFILRSIRVRFALGCENLVLVRFYSSNDDSAPTSGKPMGANLLSDYGHVDYLSGDDEPVQLHHEILVDVANTWLKVHATNNDYFDHNVSCQMEIDTLPRE